MFMLTVILAILAIGLLLTIVELFFIPGATIVGVLGLIFSIAGIVIAYKHFGSEIGMYVLLSTTAVKVAILYWSFQRKAWKKFSLKSTSGSKVNEGETDHLAVGDTGVTVSTLRPSGKAEIRERHFEVRTSGAYLENGAAIRIIEINSHQIIVESTN
jgi:membrane-bound ClpP family serine protease